MDQVYQNRPSPRHYRSSGSHDRLPPSAGGKDSVASLDTHDADDDSDKTAEQDTEEVWFPGAHGDIGGGGGGVSEPWAVGLDGEWGYIHPVPQYLNRR